MCDKIFRINTAIRAFLSTQQLNKKMSKSTEILARKYVDETPEMSQVIYGLSLFDNLHLLHESVYEKNINIDEALVRDDCGGNSGHSGGSFYTQKYALQCYHEWLLRKSRNPNTTKINKDDNDDMNDLHLCQKHK